MSHWLDYLCVVGEGFPVSHRSVCQVLPLQVCPGGHQQDQLLLQDQQHHQQPDHPAAPEIPHGE